MNGDEKCSSLCDSVDSYGAKARRPNWIHCGDPIGVGLGVEFPVVFEIALVQKRDSLLVTRPSRTLALSPT